MSESNIGRPENFENLIVESATKLRNDALDLAAINEDAVGFANALIEPDGITVLGVELDPSSGDYYILKSDPLGESALPARYDLPNLVRNSVEQRKTLFFDLIDGKSQYSGGKIQREPLRTYFGDSNAEEFMIKVGIAIGCKLAEKNKNS